MDNINSITDQGFFSYVFKLSKFKQADLLNFLQYSTLSIIPFLVLYYLVKKFSFTSTYRNSSLYMIAITLLPIILFVIGIYFIDRIINFIPTLSGKFYDVINLTNISILIIIILLTSTGGYQERTSILLYRFGKFFGIDDYVLKIVGIKNVPEFERYDGEENQWYYEVAYTKAKNKVKQLGKNDEQAHEIAVQVATKLKEVKKLQNAIDAKEIIELSKSIPTTSLGTNDDSKNPDTSNKSSTLTTPTSTPSQMNPQMNPQMPSQNSTTPTMKTTEGMYFGDGGSGDPEPANGVLGGGSGFSSWH